MEWLKKLLEAELLALQMGHIPYSPSDDKFDGNVLYWAESFATSIGRVNEGDIEIDRARIKQAFKQIRPTLERWPTPHHVLAIMKPRPQQKYLPHDPRHAEDGSGTLSEMTRALCDLSEGIITKEQFDEMMEGWES